MHRSFRFAPVLVALLGMLGVLVPTAHARECEGVRMPNAVTVEGTRLVLNGMGVREATVFNVDVYVAGLYLENRNRSAQAILDSTGPRRLVMRFVRDVERDELVDAVNAGFRHAAGSGFGALQGRLRQLGRFIPSVSEGTLLTFTYTPGTGMQVKVGRRVRGVIEGEDFARAFFGIWLGSRPPNAGLKRGLLGGACG